MTRLFLFFLPVLFACAMLAITTGLYAFLIRKEDKHWYIIAIAAVVYLLLFVYILHETIWK